MYAQPIARMVASLSKWPVSRALSAPKNEAPRVTRFSRCAPEGYSWARMTETSPPMLWATMPKSLPASCGVAWMKSLSSFAVLKLLRSQS